jgi:hypothetical protein
MCCGTKYHFLRKLRKSGVHGTAPIRWGNFFINRTQSYRRSVRARPQLSFRRPFTEPTYQTFRTTQEQVVKAQQKRMGSTKALSMTVPPYAILPPGGNDEWAVTTKKGIDKAKRQKDFGRVRNPARHQKDFPCPEYKKKDKKSSSCLGAVRPRCIVALGAPPARSPRPTAQQPAAVVPRRRRIRKLGCLACLLAV